MSLMAPRFPDYFSRTARAYSRYRPTYPAELFDYLAREAPGCGLAWDCATGSGQSAVPLGERFQRVIATDASVAQLALRQIDDRVVYAAAPADMAPLGDHTVDLVTVSQALHWFATEAFFAEVERVLVPGGLLAAWTYDLLRVDPEVDALLDRYHDDVVGAFWAPQRMHVDGGYEDLPFPFERLAPPDFRMSARWTGKRLAGYFSSWSAVGRYRRERGEDPVPLFERELAPLWADLDTEREVRWRLTLLAGRPAAR